MRRAVALGGAVLVATALAAALVFAQTGPNNQVVKAGISGQVLSLQLATVGQGVKRGDVLVFVKTSTVAAIPAARATDNGKIVQMLVSVGDFVNIGDPVAVIEVQ